jgi:hypothetical protein
VWIPPFRLVGETHEVSGRTAVQRVLPDVSVKVTAPVASDGMPETLNVEVVPYGTSAGESAAVIVKTLNCVLGESVALELA